MVATPSHYLYPFLLMSPPKILVHEVDQNWPENHATIASPVAAEWAKDMSEKKMTITEVALGVHSSTKMGHGGVWKWDPSKWLFRNRGKWHDEPVDFEIHSFQTNPLFILDKSVTSILLRLFLVEPSMCPAKMRIQRQKIMDIWAYDWWIVGWVINYIPLTQVLIYGIISFRLIVSVTAINYIAEWLRSWQDCPGLWW